MIHLSLPEHIGTKAGVALAGGLTGALINHFTRPACEYLPPLEFEPLAQTKPKLEEQLSRFKTVYEKHTRELRCEERELSELKRQYQSELDKYIRAREGFVRKLKDELVKDRSMK